MMLVSVGTFAGLDSVKSSKFTKFTTELEIMQAQVNMLNEKHKSEIDELPTGTTFTKIGLDLTGNESDSFTGAEETNTAGYRYYDKTTLEKLGIEGLEREFLVDIARRKVIAIEGLEYKGKTYYTLEQIKETPNSGGLVRNDYVTVNNITYEKIGNKYKITLENVKCSEYVGQYTVKYKEVNDTIYETLGTNIKDENYSFYVNGYGVYYIQVIDAAEKTTERPEMVISVFAGTTFAEETEITMVKSITDTGVTTENVVIPGGFTISGVASECAQTTLGVENEKRYTIDDGVVMYLLNGENADWTSEAGLLTAQKTYDQFVWVPVPNAIAEDMNDDDIVDATDIDAMIVAEKYPMAIATGTATDDEGNIITNYRGVLYDFTLTDGEVVVSDLDGSSDSTSYREPAYLIDATYADASSYNTVGITESSLQTEFNSMVEKVANNKGFWVGRYETSNMVGTASTSYSDELNKATVEADTANKVTVIKGTATGISYDSTVANWISWYRMYAQQKNYANLADISSTSSMIWGNQWDQIMIWMKEIENTAKNSYYVVNSLGMGNFGTNDDADTNITAPVATGNSEKYKVKNIYDLAGNVKDWILEAYDTSYRVTRRRSL